MRGPCVAGLRRHKAGWLRAHAPTFSEARPTSSASKRAWQPPRSACRPQAEVAPASGSVASISAPISPATQVYITRALFVLGLSHSSRFRRPALSSLLRLPFRALPWAARSGCQRFGGPRLESAEIYCRAAADVHPLPLATDGAAGFGPFGSMWRKAGASLAALDSRYLRCERWPGELFAPASKRRSVGRGWGDPRVLRRRLAAALLG